jgi:hypothetical protein
MMATEKRLIDANALKAEFTGNFHEMWHYTGIRAMIDVQPTVDAVEVMHGEWIMVIDENDCECIECPLCGGQFYDGDNDTFDKPYNYCPNCGATMDGDGNGCSA